MKLADYEAQATWGLNHLRRLIEDQIRRQYGSRNQFCKAAGMDLSDLGKFIAGKRDWASPKLFRVLLYLNLEITVRPVGQSADEDQAQKAPARMDDTVVCDACWEEGRGTRHGT